MKRKRGQIERMKAFVYRPAKDLNSGIPWFAVSYGAFAAATLAFFGGN